MSGPAPARRVGVELAVVLGRTAVGGIAGDEQGLAVARQAGQAAGELPLVRRRRRPPQFAGGGVQRPHVDAAVAVDRVEHRSARPGHGTALAKGALRDPTSNRRPVPRNPACGTRRRSGPRPGARAGLDDQHVADQRRVVALWPTGNVCDSAPRPGAGLEHRHLGPTQRRATSYPVPGEAPRPRAADRGARRAGGRGVAAQHQAGVGVEPLDAARARRHAAAPVGHPQRALDQPDGHGVALDLGVGR